jgi:NhaA family Na+:H+ antiporter
MTLFFFVVALELKREIVLGELRHVRTAALSFAGALGGMLMPACVFLVLMRGQAGMNGWGTVTATDTAFAVGCLALLGSRIPPSLRLFILSLAIFDDVGAILVVAIGYGEAVNWAAFAAAALGLAVLAGASRVGIRSIPVYFVLGIAIWLCVDASGIHPTLTGVAMGLMTPTRRWVSNIRMRAVLGRVLSHPRGEHAGGDTIERRDLRQASTAARESSSPVERLEFMLHPWVGFLILPTFAFANAGVTLSGAELMEPLSIAILVAFVLGKPAGVLSVSWLAVRLGLAARPPGLTWPLIVGGGLLTGIGFTMALFIAGLAFTPQQFADAKIGILLSSIIAALGGIAVLFWLTSGGRTTHRGHVV